DYENIALRMERVASLIDQTIALLQRGLKAGMTPPKITMRDVPAQVKAQIFDEPAKSPLFEAFTKVPAASSPHIAKLKDRAATAYRSAVVPALERLHDFLIKTYLPGCRETTAAASLPSGPALYAYNVKWHTTTNKTPQEIHEIGLAEVQR